MRWHIGLNKSHRRASNDQVWTCKFRSQFFTLYKSVVADGIINKPYDKQLVTHQVKDLTAYCLMFELQVDLPLLPL